MADLTSIKNGFKRVGAASIDPICKLIAAIAMLAIVLEVAYTLLTPLQTGNLALIIPICAYAFGYILQGVVFLIARYKITDDGSYEGSRRIIVWRYALLPLAISGVFAIIMRDVFYDHFLSLMHQGLLTQFDSYSLQPHACAVAVFLSAGAGIIVQFYHYGRLMSERVMITCIGISLLCTLFTSGSPLIGILFAIYAAGTILLMNQSYIMRSYKSLVVTKITATARLYSMRMILLCLTLSAAAGVLVFIAVNGLYRVLLFLFYLTVYTIIIKNSNAVQQKEIKTASEVVFEGDAMGEMTNKMSLVGFVLIAIFAILFFLFGRNASVRNIIDAIVRWFEEFVALFMGSRDHIREPEINYRDEVETLNKVKASRMQTALARSGKLTLREFNSEMAALKTDKERLSYSYLVMIRLLNELNTSLRRSDTPRELSEKIRATMEFPAIEDITNMIEQIKYADSKDDPLAAKRVLGEVRQMVERHLA